MQTDDPGSFKSAERGLHRALGVAEVAGITLAEITPAASLFVIAPVAIAGIGSGSLAAFLVAAVVGVFIALCYAELVAAFPFSGGDYVLVGRPLGPAVGFGMFALYGVNIVAPAILAKGAAEYLDGVLPGAGSRLTAVALLVVAGLIASRTITFNALITGGFLALELVLLTVLVILGFTNGHRSLAAVLLHPEAVTGDGTPHAVTFGAVLAFTGTALFAYNGYGGAAYLAEETRGSSRNVARAVMLAFAVTVTAEAVPLAAVLTSVPSLADLARAPAPMDYFLSSVSRPWFGKLVSVGIALGIFNATIAVFVIFGRLLYSTGRDRAWPAPVSTALARLHHRYRTPVTATVCVTTVAIACVFVPEEDLVLIVGGGVVINFALIALAALVGRVRRLTGHSPYKMRLWPLPPLLALIALSYIAQKQTFKSLAWPGGVFLVAVLYYLVRLRPNRGRRWLLDEPHDSAISQPDRTPDHR